MSLDNVASYGLFIIKIIVETNYASRVNCNIADLTWVELQSDKGDEELCSVYVPTNHLYIGDIFLVNSDDIIRPNLSIREGIGAFFSSSHAIFVPRSLLFDRISSDKY